MQRRLFYKGDDMHVCLWVHTPHPHEGNEDASTHIHSKQYSALSFWNGYSNNNSKSIYL